MGEVAAEIHISANNEVSVTLVDELSGRKVTELDEVAEEFGSDLKRAMLLSHTIYAEKPEPFPMPIYVAGATTWAWSQPHIAEFLMEEFDKWLET